MVNLSALAIIFASFHSSSSSFRCSSNGDSNVNTYGQAAEAERQRQIREEEQRKVRSVSLRLPSFSSHSTPHLPPSDVLIMVTQTLTHIRRLPKRNVSARFEQKNSADLQSRCVRPPQHPPLLLTPHRLFCHCLHFMFVWRVKLQYFRLLLPLASQTSTPKTFYAFKTRPEAATSLWCKII